MNRREFCLMMAGVTAGCSAGDNEMPQEFELVASPTRKNTETHSDVPGYGRGTWTPTLGGTATYNIQSGEWVKIGDMVFVRCALGVTLIGSGLVTSIQGLPFQPLYRTPLSIAATLNLATNVVSLTCETLVSAAPYSVYFHGRTAAQASETAGMTLWGDGSYVEFAGWYYPFLG